MESIPPPSLRLLRPAVLLQLWVELTLSLSEERLTQQLRYKNYNTDHLLAIIANIIILTYRTVYRYATKLMIYSKLAIIIDAVFVNFVLSGIIPLFF